MKFLIDTCVVSEFTKPTPRQSVTDFFLGADENKLFISSITLAELHRGIQKLTPGQKQTRLLVWLDAIEAQFANRILSFNPACAAVWGTMCASADRRGKSLSVFDALIAAIARANNLAVVTRNIDDFAETDVELINPFER
ncbi:MAG: type II toxin-antitoxin system VapC family toxin [Deltaproteobacteria bacterium]|nr:type II toxin-antitoxin system VapC family toxin [Deltaproteobacteria bacterium]MBN2672085.1 type II toxin-antitoxin system VapC family toxin [Deltaproteobacteria bacterium]